MEDLNNLPTSTDLVVVNQNPANEPKGFVASRMNKDNFWNIMFGVGFATGFALTRALDGYRNLSFITIWATILLVPYLVKINSRVTFNQEKGFINSQGKSLSKNLPSGAMFFFALAGIGITSFVFDNFVNISVETVLGNFLITFSIFSGFILYFILINCPISILFNKNLWSMAKDSDQSSSYTHSSHHDRHSRISYPERSPYNDPTKSWMIGNIYNRRD